MNKNRILIIAALLTLAIGGYFLFFFDRSDGEAESTENISADSTESNSLLLKRKQTLEKEQANPQEYVEIEIDPKKNLFGETVIEGTLTNKASLTSYKDFELMIHWNDEKGVALDSAVEMILENLDPGENVAFKTKRKGPRHSKSTLMRLRAAKAAVN
ncbi:MAG TPA: FxLYD domain-containing protein [Bacteroidia bacterium]|nr:FxLYD domain-containing protein [Bacteroidia bacterium]